VDWLENNDLGGKYYEGAVPIVEGQITKAGVRLAGWINALAAANTAATAFTVQGGQGDGNAEL
jgi:hypothetical protein